MGGVAATVITRAGDRGHHIIMGGISGYKRAVHVIKAAAAAGWEKEAMCSVAKRSRRAGRDAGGAVAMQEASMRDPRWGGRRAGCCLHVITASGDARQQSDWRALQLE